MSLWTHINGIIKVDTHNFLTSDEVINYMKWVCDKLPNIPGSERSAEVFISASKYTNGGLYDELGERRYFNEAYLTISGDLRDRELPDTKCDVKMFLSALERYVFINEVELTINDDGVGIVQFSSRMPKIKRKNFEMVYVDTAYNERSDYITEQMYKNWDKYLAKKAADLKYIIAENIGHLTDVDLEGVIECSPLFHRIDWDFSDTYIKKLIAEKKKLPYGLSKEYIAEMRAAVKQEAANAKQETDDGKK